MQGLVVFVVVLFISGLLWMLADQSGWRAAFIDRLRAAPRVAIRDFPDGRVAKIVGTVRESAAAVQAPVSRRRCVYYFVEVEEDQSDDDSLGGWRTIVTEQAGCDFLVDDGTGTALVLIAGAQGSLIEDVHLRSGFLDAPTPEMQALLARHDKSTHGWILPKRLRYREGILELGETAAVCGHGMLEPDPNPATAGAYRERAMRPVLRSTPDNPVLLSDNVSSFGPVPSRPPVGTEP